MLTDWMKNYIIEEKKILDRIPLQQFEEVVELLHEAYKTEKQIFVFGNGGSAATASHFGFEVKCPNTSNEAATTTKPIIIGFLVHLSRNKIVR